MLIRVPVRGYAGFMRYAHTNVVAKDWRGLAQFYVDVFECRVKPPEREQSGEWLARGTGVPNASLAGVHLLLPGHGDAGPTLEVFGYGDTVERAPGKANRQGYGHLAFEVEDVQAVAEKVVAHGGSLEGAITRHPVDGVGMLTFVYVRDPEGNIVEIQSWDRG